MLLVFLGSQKYILLNSSEKSIGEPWTRVDPVNNSKSVLDLVIVSEDLMEYVKEFNIDNLRKVAPFNVNKDKSITYSDHYALTVIFNNIPRDDSSTNKTVKFTKWNLKKPNGWDTFRSLTENNAKFEDI